jgi:hypothetical protein
MSENIGALVKQFKVDSAATDNWKRVKGDTVFMQDGRNYTFYEPDNTHPNSLLCVFDFDSGSLKYSAGRNPEGSSVGQIKVDFKTDSELNIVDLNPVNLETNSGNTPPYEGITVTVSHDRYNYQVRYRKKSDNYSIVQYDGIYLESGEAYSEQNALKEQLQLPKEIDIVTTAIQLLTTEGNIFELRKNPFALPPQ